MGCSTTSNLLLSCWNILIGSADNHASWSCQSNQEIDENIELPNKLLSKSYQYWNEVIVQCNHRQASYLHSWFVFQGLKLKIFRCWGLVKSVCDPDSGWWVVVVSRVDNGYYWLLTLAGNCNHNNYCSMFCAPGFSWFTINGSGFINSLLSWQDDILMKYF